MIREGRLGKGFDKEVALYTSSLDFDQDLFKYDLQNNMAHLVMLIRQGIIGNKEGKKILAHLEKIEKMGIKAIDLDPEQEDIHMTIESSLIKELGETGGKLHTARSRNDQVATDLRMKTRDDVNILSKSLISLTLTLLERSEENTLTLLPSYTHLQHAQPTTLTHHMMAYVQSLLRNLDRIEESYRRIDLCPLGSGAVTTTSFPIDRQLTAELLGFKGILKNSMDAVSSRDYMVETASICALISIDISRIVEELILWSTQEFSFIELSDDFASTSSIMPQKKNPDLMEIIRARTSNTIGSFTSLQIMLKGLSQSYNRDLQEASPVFFSILDNVSTSLLLLSQAMKTMKINEENMGNACAKDFSTATELADLIVRERNIPFRSAHQIVGALVTTALKQDLRPEDISSGFLDKVSESVSGKELKLTDEAITGALTPLLAVKSRKIMGGPAPEVQKKLIGMGFDSVVEKERNLSAREEVLSNAQKKLKKHVSKILGE